ncbi:lipopolysaccharide export system protein LptC [Natronocella acetinitrilica]|uniref:Lipopolysaccharide export system protein LptC n=1 Tax=Natronocella acetinitrilica TaxID=414046 RepID=A0AAE3G2M7_9GAMM|nr:LPS export ABC transporter periplasmic protein LptC [Natronocella acetinitrilica]MCP1673889.1 lipopolysaccharide export system protein LptC [Natronocella acetinitrilica]
MHRRWVFRIVAGLVIAAAGWWILDEDTVDPVVAPDSLERERTPDYFVENFTLDATDEQGVRTYRLQGDTMTHFMDDDLWRVQQPWMIYYTESGSPWHLRSERGRAWNSVTEAMLEGDVTIRREASDENLEANIDTSEVYLRPQARYAETDQYAVYYRDGLRISGIGVRGYLDRQQIEMLSEVRGVYEPAVD